MQVICINGGPITQVEQEEMPRILSEARSDAAKSGDGAEKSARAFCGADAPKDRREWSQASSAYMAPT